MYFIPWWISCVEPSPAMFEKGMSKTRASSQQNVSRSSCLSPAAALPESSVPHTGQGQGTSGAVVEAQGRQCGRQGQLASSLRSHKAGRGRDTGRGSHGEGGHGPSRERKGPC